MKTYRFSPILASLLFASGALAQESPPIHPKVGGLLKAADVWMIQTGDGAGFSLESLFELRVIGKMRGKDFNGDRTIESSVLGFVDLTHATRTERCEDFIGTQLSAGS